MEAVECQCLTKNIVHLADSVKNEDDSNNKHSAKLKIWSVEMPNAPYLNRCAAYKRKQKWQY